METCVTLHLQSAVMDWKENKGLVGTRQLTPPDSPLPPLRNVLGSSSQESTSGKMSLNFIAPGSLSSLSPTSPTSPSSTYSVSSRSSFSCANELPSVCLAEVVQLNQEELIPNIAPNTSNHTRSYKAVSPTPGLPSPAWSSCSEPCHPSSPSSHNKKQRSTYHYHQRQRTPQYQQPRSAIYAYSTISHVSPSRLSRLSRHGNGHGQSPVKRPQSPTAAPRPERHPYDSEERYAIIHLRAVLGLKWEDVLKEFSRLFPVGQPRRCKVNLAPGMPQTYQARNVQGLQCRWYRIREEEGLRPLRRGEMVEAGAGSEEAMVLDRMADEEVCGVSFLREFR
jgi:hypothetical protein